MRRNDYLFNAPRLTVGNDHKDAPPSAGYPLGRLTSIRLRRIRCALSSPELKEPVFYHRLIAFS